MSGQQYPQLPRSKARSIAKLLRRKGREESGLFVVEGRQAVAEALRRPELVQSLVVADPAAHRDLLDLIEPEKVYLAKPEDIRALSGTITPQGIFAVSQQVSVALSELAQPRLVAICEQINNPGNAGTIIRCADAFGADAVILTRGSVDPYNPKAVRASVGSIFHIPIVTGVDLSDVVTWCQGWTMPLLAADISGIALTDLVADGTLHTPIAWLFGNEAWGLPESVVSLADYQVRIPMWGQAESLNLATAAAVCLYTTAAQQRSADQHQRG